jgi:hypothetical protein
MSRFREGPVALGALIAFALWMFVALPLIYLPEGFHLSSEPLGVRLGEWLLIAATLGLWWATVRLVRGADRTAERQLRAYVSVESGTYCRQNKRKRLNFDFQPLVTNNGVSPAYDVRMVSNIGVVSPIIPAEFNYTLPVGPNPSVTMIAPGQKRVHTVIYKQTLKLGDMRKVIKGELCFHVYGTVFYLDIFKKQRQTNYSFTIFVPSRKSGSPVWHFTEYNNDAT